MLLKRALPLAAALMISAPAALMAEGHADAETVVATVNGTEITLGHMIVLKQRLPAQYQQLPPDVLFNGVLDQLVQQTLLGQSGDDLSVGSVKTLENEERALRASEVIRGVAEGATTDEALQAAYDEAFAGAEPETEYNASHILVETEEEAAAIVTELEGGADFATLAQERSTGPSGPNGGQLGWFGMGAMVAPFEKAVVAMEPETISAPVQTQFGWHVIRLNEVRQMEAPTLDEVRDQLTEQLQRSAIEARIAELTEGAEVTRSTVEDIDPALLDDLSLLGE
ncbi:MAG: peptidylprolyl isomerase [Paracoccaceae bacterium]|nr:peptidylprolyl isomerase [Paracoccaceae bacterium]